MSKSRRNGVPRRSANRVTALSLLRTREPGEPQHAACWELWRKLRTGDLDDEIETRANQIQQILVRKRPILKGAEDLLARCLVAEVYDHRCRYKEAQAIVENAAVGLLADWSAGSIEREPQTLAQQVHVAIQYADASYRLGDWSTADQMLIQCLETTRDHLALSPPRPGFDPPMRAMAVEDIYCRISFSRGRLARQKGFYENSEGFFSDCIGHALKRLSAAAEKLTGERLSRANAYARLTCANALSLGLAWMFVHKGSLRAARSLISTAQIIYAPTENPIHKAFCEMLQGAIERSHAGKDKDLLEKAIRRLDSAKATFDSLHHARYGAVAAYYLATSYFQSEIYDKAAELGRQIAILRPGDNRWESFSRIVLSRVCREQGDPEKARSIAKEASAMAENGPHIDCQVDAIVALGEAQLRCGDREDARKTFSVGLERCGKMVNLKWTGACYLHLVETYLEGGNHLEADSFMKRWRQIAPQIENGFLQAFAAKLDARLNTMQHPFHIDLSETDLRLNKHRDELERFLVKRALILCNMRLGEASRQLGISRPTLNSIIKTIPNEDLPHGSPDEPDATSITPTEQSTE